MSKHMTLKVTIVYDEATVTDEDGLASYLEELGYQMVERDDLAPQGEVIDDYTVEVTTKGGE